MCDDYKVPFLGSLPLDIHIREQADSGRPTVVSDPDGTVYFPFRGYQVPVAGKSGTAETSTPGRVNAWFIGFAPFDAPRLAIATVYEQYAESPGHYGSQDAATATRKVLAVKLGGTP